MWQTSLASPTLFPSQAKAIIMMPRANLAPAAAPPWRPRPTRALMLLRASATCTCIMGHPTRALMLLWASASSGWRGSGPPLLATCTCILGHPLKRLPVTAALRLTGTTLLAQASSRLRARVSFRGRMAGSRCRERGQPHRVRLAAAARTSNHRCTGTSPHSAPRQRPRLHRRHCQRQAQLLLRRLHRLPRLGVG